MPEFLRRCELLVGPLADWQTNNPAQALRIVADGSNSRLRVAFTANKTVTGEPNKTDLLLYNLSKETRQAIRANSTKVQILAGYASDTSSTGVVCNGGVLAVYSERQGPDIVTRLTVLDGWGGISRGAYSRAFAGGVPLGDVIRDVARNLPGVALGQIDVDGALGPKGASLGGSSQAVLNRLADTHGFSWSVQDGVFQAIADRRTTGRSFTFTSGNNLLSAVPLFNGPLQAKVGVQVTALFDARMRPGDEMRVQSQVNPSVNGTYKATSVTLTFDTHGPAQLRAQSLHLF